MQIAASPTVDFVKSEDINEEVKEAERQAEMKSEDLEGKPEDIKVKMVEGRLGKILKQKVRRLRPLGLDACQRFRGDSYRCTMPPALC